MAPWPAFFWRVYPERHDILLPLPDTLKMVTTLVQNSRVKQWLFPIQVLNIYFFPFIGSRHQWHYIANDYIYFSNKIIGWCQFEWHTIHVKKVCVSEWGLDRVIRSEWIELTVSQGWSVQLMKMNADGWVLSPSAIATDDGGWSDKFVFRALATKLNQKTRPQDKHFTVFGCRWSDATRIQSHLFCTSVWEISKFMEWKNLKNDDVSDTNRYCIRDNSVKSRQLLCVCQFSWYMAHLGRLKWSFWVYLK